MSKNTGTDPTLLRPSRPPLSQRAKRVLLGIAIALAVSLVATGTILAASQQRGHGTPLTTKQQRIDAANTQEAQARLIPAATKGPPVPTPATCPDAFQSDITNNLEAPTTNAGGVTEHIINIARVSYTRASPYNYFSIAGWSVDNPQQGVIIVERDYYDPCSPKAPSLYYLKAYLTPYQKGGVKLTALQGPSSVTFTTQDGASGTFNYVTGQFS